MISAPIAGTEWPTRIYKRRNKGGLTNEIAQFRREKFLSRDVGLAAKRWLEKRGLMFGSDSFNLCEARND